MSPALPLALALALGCTSPGGTPAGDGGPGDAARDTAAGPADDTGRDTADTGADPFAPDPRCPAADPEADPEGIHKHRIDRVVSTDGLGFRESGDAPLRHASVPDAFVLDGAVHAIVVDGTPGRHGLWLARDAGGLALVDCVLVDEAWDPLRVDPDVVPTEDGVRLYWLEGVDPAAPPPTSRRVWTALSSDGRRFHDAQVALELPFLTDPSVARGPDGRWWMAHSLPERRTGLAVSEDGRTFTETDLRLADDVPELVATEAGLRLYTTRGEQVVSLASPDATTWTAEEGIRWMPGFSPSALARDGETWLWIVSQEDQEQAP